jgi:hypothetical protein
MRHGMRPCGRLVLLLALALPCGACATPPAPVRAALRGDRSLDLRVVDHLGFGARVESVTVLVDGIQAMQVDGAARGEALRLSLEPGSHDLSILARASEPCGLLEEPRASITMRAETSLSVGEGHATLEADLYTREATSDPLRNLTIRFTGRALALGTPVDALDASRHCDKSDVLCVLDARAALARSRADVPAASCFDAQRDEARALEGTLEDSYAAVTRKDTTAGQAESAQLRARYARARLLSLPAEAEACAVATRPAFSTVVVARKVERSCPTPDVTATLGGF